MDEKIKDNKLNESEIEEVSGGCTPKKLHVKFLNEFFKLQIVKYGFPDPPNWPPKKKPEQNPTDPVKPNDTTDNTAPKVDPNSEKKL